jgi:molybdopterin-guanine dinucleotide biosynthesis protein A
MPHGDSAHPNSSLASAIILAGGRSSRMGRAKPALPFGQVTILQRIIAELRLVFDDVIVVSAPALAEAFDPNELVSGTTGVRLIRDEVEYAGPAVALARGLVVARNEISFVCSCDLPLLRAEVAQALCDWLREMPASCAAVIPEISGRLQPLAAAYRSTCGPIIAAIAADGESRLTAITMRLNTRQAGEAELRRLDPELLSFLNVNTPEDYARALRLAGL